MCVARAAAAGGSIPVAPGHATPCGLPGACQASCLPPTLGLPSLPPSLPSDITPVMLASSLVPGTWSRDYTPRLAQLQQRLRASEE